MFSIVEKAYEKLLLMKKKKTFVKKVQLSAARIVTGPPIVASNEVNPFT